MIRIKELTSYLESLAPLSTQESYDNSGLIIGDPNKEVSSALFSLDCTEEIVDEAIAAGISLIIAHHPIVFKGLKSITGKNYVERTILKAIKNDIAIYAIHTNFDNYKHGVNAEIAERIGLKNTSILAPKHGVLSKLHVFVPSAHLEAVREALFSAGAGQIGKYSECSFSNEGLGTFKAGDGTNPFVGEIGKRQEEKECKIEVLLPTNSVSSVLNAVRGVHPYEEIAYDIVPLSNVNQDNGSGMIGELDEEIDVLDFLNHLKQTFGAEGIRYTNAVKPRVKKIALCGGSGSFLIEQAKRAGADVYVTGDVKYHEFFDADGQIMIADIGHYESEQFTSNRLAAVIKEKFPKFAVHLTRNNTNPINYF